MPIETFLDLYDVLVNQVAGSIYIFLFLSLITIAIIGAQMKMPDSVIALILLVYLLFLSAFFPFLLPITLYIAGAFVGWQLYKFIRG